MSYIYGRDLSGRIFYKISKSSKSIAKQCLEPHYLDYPENSVVKDIGEHRICFVPAENIIMCVGYGDRLTEILFDNFDPRFEAVANEEVCITNPIFDEHNARVVITGKNYSLAMPDTIERIIQLSSAQNVLNAARIDGSSKLFSISAHLSRLGFCESLDFWVKHCNALLL